MTDTHDALTPEPAPQPSLPSPPHADKVVPHLVAPDPAKPRRHDPAKALTMLGLALLTLGLCWVWLQQQQGAAQLEQLGGDVSRLASRPAPDVTARDVTALTARITKLEQRLAALEQRPTANIDLSPLEARVSALEQRPAGAEAGPRLVALEQMQAASTALAAGRKLGVIPGAPPALARFAETAPPTEAGLRLEYRPLAARAAEASRPATESQSMAERMWLQVQTLVTVTDHEKVLVGAPARVVLGEAEEKLNAGDLAGAVATLGALDSGAAGVMADWRARAQALLDARAALAIAASEATSSPDEALRLARQAWTDAKALAPAALAYAGCLRTAGHERKAIDVVRETWALAPHPDLVEFITAPGADAVARLKLFTAFIQPRAAHPEAQFALARLSLDAGALGDASYHLEAAEHGGLTDRRIGLLRADIARANHQPDAERAALRAATLASLPPRWKCAACGTEQDAWHPSCEACHAVGQIAWGQTGALLRLGSG